MKKIEIIIRPSVFDKVREALSSLGVNGMNYQEIKGFGRQHGHVEVYRGTTINVDFLPKVRFEVVTKDDSVERIIQAVLDAARTGRVGDGKIFISDVQDAIRIRTGERGDDAAESRGGLAAEVQFGGQRDHRGSQA